MGQDDIELFAKSYGRDHFKRMIEKTFADYYPMEYDRAKFKLQEYMDVVSNENLETRFGV